MPMKTPAILCALCIGLSLLPTTSGAQGTFIYDQQSASEGTVGEFSVNVLSNQPVGQSFRPALGSLDFVRLYFINGGVGGSAYLNLRSNSIDGPIIATSQSVTLPDAYKGYSNFFFPSSVPLVAGDVYVFQPVILSGTGWLLNYHNGFGYAQGAAIFGGVQQT